MLILWIVCFFCGVGWGFYVGGGGGGCGGGGDDDGGVFVCVRIAVYYILTGFNKLVQGSAYKVALIA